MSFVDLKTNRNVSKDIDGKSHSKIMLCNERVSLTLPRIRKLSKLSLLLLNTGIDFTMTSTEKLKEFSLHLIVLMLG